MSNNQILNTLRYFHQFSYAPTLEELYVFHPVKLSNKNFLKRIEKLVKNKKIIEKDLQDNAKRYTLGGYRIGGTVSVERARNALRKRGRAAVYVSAARFIPSVQPIGLSGSVAMNNAGTGDDIDLFVIARRNRIFTARFWLVTLAVLFGQKRPKNAPKSHITDKLCLNMFFDESDLSVPKYKRNYYVAHEVLQMKPILDKNGTYSMFLQANSWVFRSFPNAKDTVNAGRRGAPHSPHISTLSPVKRLVYFLGDLFEYALKTLQLWKINKGKTTEIVTNTQLWFFPDDFEKKVRHTA